MRVIEAQKVKAIVDEYVEVLQKVVPKDPADVGIGLLELCQILNDNERVGNNMRSSLK